MWATGKFAPRAGFTLIELLVILAVLSLVSGIVFPSVERALRRQAFAASATRIEVALRTARGDAVRSGRAVRFTAGADRHGFAYGGTIEQLPASATIFVPSEGLTFFADGSATGGEIALADGEARRRWKVTASTGAIARAR